MNSWQFTWRLTREKTWPSFLWPNPLGVSLQLWAENLLAQAPSSSANVYCWSFMIPGENHNKNRRKEIATILWPVAQTSASYLYLSLLLTCRGASVPTSKDAWAVFLPEFPGKSWSLLWAKEWSPYPPYQCLTLSHNFQLCISCCSWYEIACQGRHHARLVRYELWSGLC